MSTANGRAECDPIPYRNDVFHGEMPIWESRSNSGKSLLLNLHRQGYGAQRDVPLVIWGEQLVGNGHVAAIENLVYVAPDERLIVFG